jgi:hypothetical protein
MGRGGEATCETLDRPVVWSGRVLFTTALKTPTICAKKCAPNHGWQDRDVAK